MWFCEHCDFHGDGKEALRHKQQLPSHLVYFMREMRSKKVLKARKLLKEAIRGYTKLEMPTQEVMGKVIEAEKYLR